MARTNKSRNTRPTSSTNARVRWYREHQSARRAGDTTADVWLRMPKWMRGPWRPLAAYGYARCCRYSAVRVALANPDLRDNIVGNMRHDRYLRRAYPFRPDLP